MRPRAGRADLVVGRIGRQLVAIPERDQYEHLLLVAPTGAGKTSGRDPAQPARRTGHALARHHRPETRTAAQVLARDARALRRRNTSGRSTSSIPTLSRGYNPLAYVTDAATADLFAQTWVAQHGRVEGCLLVERGAHADRRGGPAPRRDRGDHPAARRRSWICCAARPPRRCSAVLAGEPGAGGAPARAGLPRQYGEERAAAWAASSPNCRRASPASTSPKCARSRAPTRSPSPGLRREPTALYLALDPQYSRTLAPLTACFFLHFFTTLTAIAKAAPSGALPVPVLAYLDEFGTVGHIPEFASRMATVRSAGIGCLLVVQDLAQLTKAYGAEDADTILSNATTKLCLGRVTHDDAEYFSKLAGTTTVYSANRSASRPLLLPWADRGNRGVGEVAAGADHRRTSCGRCATRCSWWRGIAHPIRARQRRYYDDPALARLVPRPARAGSRSSPCGGRRRSRCRRRRRSRTRRAPDDADQPSHRLDRRAGHLRPIVPRPSHRALPDPARHVARTACRSVAAPAAGSDAPSGTRRCVVPSRRRGGTHAEPGAPAAWRLAATPDASSADLAATLGVPQHGAGRPDEVAPQARGRCERRSGGGWHGRAACWATAASSQRSVRRRRTMERNRDAGRLGR